MIKKLRIKFVAINMSIVTLLLAIILGMVYYSTRIQMENQSIQMMQSIAINPLQMNTPLDPDEEVRLPYFAIQLSPYGERMIARGGYYDLTDDSLLDDLVSRVYVSHQRIGVIPRYNLRYCLVDAPRSHYLVFADISSELATLSSLTKICILIGVLGFLGFLTASILLSGWAVKPVEQTLKRQREFVADASHELKTPLTVIMTNAQFMQDGTHAQELQNRSLENILTMSGQMKSLIEKMLMLARTDTQQSKLSVSQVNWSKTISDGILPFEPLFFEQGLTLESWIDPDIFVMGNEAQLRQVLEIFLDNAQKYARPHGHVWVKLEKHSKRKCLLAVANEGEAIPSEKLCSLFERFYRADEARSRNGSFGLGLSIAKSIGDIHRAKLWAESKNGINTFYFEMNCREKQLQ